MGIGGEGRRAVRAEGAHVDTLAHGLEQTRERDVALVQCCRSAFSERYFFAADAGRRRLAVGVARRPLRSIAARIEYDVGAGCVELHRFARDVDADGAAEAVRVPLEHVALRDRDARRSTTRWPCVPARRSRSSTARTSGLQDAARRSRRWRERRPSAAPRREADVRQRRHGILRGIGAFCAGWRRGGGFGGRFGHAQPAVCCGVV